MIATLGIALSSLMPTGMSIVTLGGGRWGLAACVLAWFTTPVQLTGLQRLALLIPLCLSISVVYKTIKCRSLREMPLAILALWGTIVSGMFGVGIALWLAFQLLA